MKFDKWTLGLAAVGVVSLASASGVPSASTASPAWMEYPIPTPPPWCTDTQDAPETAFRRAFRMGQSAMASEPSFIPSVSL